MKRVIYKTLDRYIRTAIAYLLYHVGDQVFELYEQKNDRVEVYWLYNWCMQKSFEFDTYDQVWNIDDPQDV